MTLPLFLVLTAILIPTVLTLRYAHLCWSRPFTHCRRCAGTGRVRSAFGLSTRECRPCQGIGYRLRTGRHVLNYVRRLHHDARTAAARDQANQNTHRTNHRR
ncbi:hypothetical protein GCM10009765_59860 [Fodinicola feengrottensis]|uniref:Uncharacterized protein n=1 Tax=Fodinicola feengrottensis TaxID=435914 RepID=A0ABN2ID42_9ACTN